MFMPAYNFLNDLNIRGLDEGCEEAVLNKKLPSLIKNIVQVKTETCLLALQSLSWIQLKKSTQSGLLKKIHQNSKY